MRLVYPYFYLKLKSILFKPLLSNYTLKFLINDKHQMEKLDTF